MISDAANTEKPSSIMDSLFIGGALAARSVYTLQNLGITHILCLCANEIGISDSQYPEIFEYQNFSVSAKYLFHFLPLKNPYPLESRGLGLYLLIIYESPN